MEPLYQHLLLTDSPHYFSLAQMMLLFLVAALTFKIGSCAGKLETITGSIYCDNEFTFYVNGKFIINDTFPITKGHNAVNVTFTVTPGEDIVFAIEGRDWADEVTGLEFGNRCIGDGGLRAVFSNGVVTNSSWTCANHHYGPLNWKQCFGAQTERNQSLQLHPACFQDSTPPLTGCNSRITPKPPGWTSLDFDDSHWEYALEYTEERVGYGLPPLGCEVPGAAVSSEVDTNGDPAICPQNLDWGDSKFIWRPDLDLDNTILCRYTMKVGNSAAGIRAISTLTVAIATIIQYLSF